MRKGGQLTNIGGQITPPYARHSGASAIGLIPNTIFFLFNGELLLLLFGVGCAFLAATGTDGKECNTSGGCLVCSHEMNSVRMSEGILMPPTSSSSSRSSRSSSEM